MNMDPIDKSDIGEACHDLLEESSKLAAASSGEYAQRVRVQGGPTSGKAMAQITAAFSDGFETGAQWAVAALRQRFSIPDDADGESDVS